MRIKIGKELRLIGTLSGYSNSVIEKSDEQLVHTSEKIMLKYLFVAFLACLSKKRFVFEHIYEKSFKTLIPVVVVYAFGDVSEKAREDRYSSEAHIYPENGNKKTGG